MRWVIPVGQTISAAIAAMAISTAGTLCAQSFNPGDKPGTQGSSNVHLVSHIPLAVIGVLPPGFAFPNSSQIWMSRENANPRLPSRSASGPSRCVGNRSPTVPAIWLRGHEHGRRRRAALAGCINGCS